MSNDPMDLPVRRINSTLTGRQNAELVPRVSLTEQQVSTLLETGGRVADGTISIAKDLVEISRLKAQSEAEVAGIEARTRAIVASLRAETERLIAVRKGVRTRGEVAVGLIKTILEKIPESDHVARQNAIAMLNQLVATVISEPNSSTQSRT